MVEQKLKNQRVRDAVVGVLERKRPPINRVGARGAPLVPPLVKTQLLPRRRTVKEFPHVLK